MSRSGAMTIAMILGGALLGALVAGLLFSWELQTRASRYQVLPSPTPVPAGSFAPPAPPYAPSPSPAPQGTPALIEPNSESAAGAQVFAAKCNACHPNGNAGVGPGVRDLETKFPDDESLRNLIRSGRGGMPGYPTSALSDADLEALVAYLRTLE